LRQKIDTAKKLTHNSTQRLYPQQRAATMQQAHDILGIEHLLSKAQTEIESYEPTPDEFQRWNDHPITQRLKKQLAIDLYFHLFDSPVRNVEYCAMLQGIIAHGVESKTND
jgi:hypothetical protein